MNEIKEMNKRSIEKILSVAFDRASDPNTTAADLEILSRIACNIYAAIKQNDLSEILSDVAKIHKPAESDNEYTFHFNGSDNNDDN